MTTNLYTRITTLQRQLRDYVQTLRLEDLKAAIPGVIRLSWEREGQAVAEGLETPTSVWEIYVEVATCRGKVSISLGTGNLDARPKCLLASLQKAANIRDTETDFGNRLATAADGLGLPGCVRVWKHVAGLALGYVEETGASSGLVDIEHALDAASAARCPAAQEAIADLLSLASATAAGHTVESYLITSTGHVTAAERDIFDAGKAPTPSMILSQSGDYGWMIHLSDTLPDTIPGLSDGLAAVVEHARAHGLRYIRFDADGPAIEGAPTYEW